MTKACQFEFNGARIIYKFGRKIEKKKKVLWMVEISSVENVISPRVAVVFCLFSVLFYFILFYFGGGGSAVVVGLALYVDLIKPTGYYWVVASSRRTATLFLCKIVKLCICHALKNKPM